MRTRIYLGFVLAAVIALSCKDTKEGGNKTTVDELGPVVERHSEHLMGLPGVTAVAVGALDDGTPCILVLIVEDTQEIRAGLPATLEGHPVKVEVSGVIRPLDADSSS